MLREELVQEIRDYLDEISADSNVYIGCDSSRYRDRQGTWYANYTTAVVVHKNNSQGCRVFCDSETMVDYDQKKNRPMMRMMNEAYKAVEAYEQLEEDLLEHDVEVHLDINEDERHGSNCARGAAVGIAMQTGRPVKTKPEAFAASYVADHAVRGKFSKRPRLHA